jgi:hypothetical protein
VRTSTDPEISFRAQALAGRLVELDARISLSFVEAKLRKFGAAGVALRSSKLRTSIPTNELVEMGRRCSSATDEVVTAWAAHEQDSAELERVSARACAVLASFLDFVGETDEAFLAGVGFVSKI